MPVVNSRSGRRMIVGAFQPSVPVSGRMVIMSVSFIHQFYVGTGFYIMNAPSASNYCWRPHLGGNSTGCSGFRHLSCDGLHDLYPPVLNRNRGSATRELSIREG